MNYRNRAFSAAKKWTQWLRSLLSSNMALLKYFANPSPAPTLTVSCQASWSQRRSIVPTERCLPCSLLPIALAQRMTDPGNVRTAHIPSLPLGRRLRSLDMRLSQGVSKRLWDILSSGVSTWRRVPSGRGKWRTRKDCRRGSRWSHSQSRRCQIKNKGYHYCLETTWTQQCRFMWTKYEN